MFAITFFLVAVALFMLLDMIKPAYGVAFDVATGEYVDTAFVILLNADTGAEIARTLTDMRGRYYFFVQPGRYRLAVERTHFSVRHTTNPFSILYGAPYTGGVIERKRESAISVPLALHKDAPDWNHENKLAIQREIAGFRVYLRWAVLVVAFIHVVTSMLLFAFSLSPLFAVISVMMLVWWWFFLYDHSPINGAVHWQRSGRRDGYISVHGYSDILVKKVPLTALGNYWALIPPGKYTTRVYEYHNTGANEPKLVREYEHVAVPTGILNKSFLV